MHQSNLISRGVLYLFLYLIVSYSLSVVPNRSAIKVFKERLYNYDSFFANILKPEVVLAEYCYNQVKRAANPTRVEKPCSKLNCISSASFFSFASVYAEVKFSRLVITNSACHDLVNKVFRKMRLKSIYLNKFYFKKLFAK